MYRCPQGSLAPVRVLLSRSITAYYDPMRQSRRHAATSRSILAYTQRLRCAGAPRRPTRPSLLSLARCPHVPPTLPRWVRRPLPLLLGSAIPGSLELRASRHPQPRLCQQYMTGVPFEAASFASCCGPCVCPALRTGYDRVRVHPTPRLLRYRVTPAFGTGRRRAVLGVRLDGRTGNLPSSGLAPD